MPIKIPSDKRVWITSDSHFSHTNIIKYSNRPFTDQYSMDEEIIKRWNETVSKGDIVFHLGDFSFRQNPMEIWDRLNGEKHIIFGNHDHKRPGKLPFESDSILVLNYKNRVIVLCHYPLESWVQKSHSSLHCHGHVHNSWPFVTGQNRVNVCMEHTDYKPISYEQIIGRYNKEFEKVKLTQPGLLERLKYVINPSRLEVKRNS